MKRRIAAIVLLLISLMMPFLSSCDSGDADALVNWAKLWALVHGITNEEGNISYGAGARYAGVSFLGLDTTGDKEGDAAIDIASSTKNTMDKIRDAEKEADEGWKALDGGSNVEESVLPHYNKAVDLRPNDWSYRNERGIALIADAFNDNYKAARADFDKAVDLARKSGKPEDYLKMLRQREQSLATHVQHKNAIGAMPTQQIYEEQYRVYDELYTLTKNNDYLLLKQQADSNLRQGNYWRRDTGN